MPDRRRLQGAAMVALLLALPAAAAADGASGRTFAVNERLGRGVNIIGYDPIWQDRTKARFQERHFARIKEAGFDSVRIVLHPFRHMDAANGFALKPAWLETLDWAVKGALAARLAVVLDMHEFHAMSEDPVGRKEAWLSFWRQVAPRFKDAPEELVFELLNEPFGKLTPDLWNDYLKQGLALVRTTNPARAVILGPGRWNSIDALPGLVLPEDDRNLIVTVHYYTPMEFTHQGAPWNEENKDRSGVPWAGTDQEGRRIERDFARAQEWASAHDRPVFLGEFGAYDKAPMDSRARYTAAVARAAERLGWSWAYWQFDSDFVVYDIGRDAWVDPLRDALLPTLRLNELEYLDMPGLNVMLAHDYYPEGHQGGVGIIQNGLRIATNGDIRLDRTPGQWQPVPKVGKRVVDRATGEISLRAEYPDESKNRKGFNPVDYPDLRFGYTVRVRPEGQAFRILVDLEQPLPDEWIGKVGFNMELFPGILFGKTYATESSSGIFPRQPNGPGTLDAKGEYRIAPLATGKRLTIAPESDRQRMTIEDVTGGGLELVDGRGQHNNGWFVVRSLVAKGAAKGAVEWLVAPHAIPGFTSAPTVQVSQVGYHPRQQKWAIVEVDARDTRRLPVVVSRITEAGALERAVEAAPQPWGRFLRFDYLRLDFTSVEKPGMYLVSYGDARSRPFRIATDVFQRHVWQPTVDSFLPVQMCHVRVNERYRVWHDACHLDDARMAPVSHNHFDGYFQGLSTLTRYAPGEPVPGLNRGGWHDAGDDDLRVESQADTMHGLALAWEAFRPSYDDTSIDQKLRVVEMHQPDGKPDVLQQVEHGALTVVGGYRALGRFYRGIISPTLRQYTHLGDFAAQTDNAVFDAKAARADAPPVGTGVPGSPDDRWVFTEQNPRRELGAAAGLAASARALRGYDDALAAECVAVAREIWDVTREDAAAAPPWGRSRPNARIGLAVELLLTTGDRRYAEYLLSQKDAIVKGVRSTGWVVGRALPLVGDAAFTSAVTEAVRAYRTEVAALEKKTPYGVPYEPAIWGAGWGIQAFGMEQYFLHASFPEIFPKDAILHALDFVLGVHPGPNNASFVSGVGSRSVLVAYGLNRADWGYIPGGSVSGTALIRPDYPELLEWPYLWQQTEYVLGGGTTDYLFLVLAADHLLNRE